MYAKLTLFKFFKHMAPPRVVRFARRIRLSGHAMRADWIARRSESLSALVSFACNPRKNPLFYACQKETEILPFLELVKSCHPGAVLEIGAASGGNLFLLAQAAADNALLLSMDMDYPNERVMTHGKLVKAGQRLECVCGDSHEPETMRTVRHLLRGVPLDVLFIDGDHSYEGVKADFEMYAPLVRRDGLIAFHDIVPDYRTRFGIETGRHSGEVYRFWSELKERYHEVVEFVDSRDQDAFGIGVLRWPGSA